MRDIKQVMERWGAWARHNWESVSWYTRAPGIGNLIPYRGVSQPSCCDSDGMAVSECMARLRKAYPDSHDILYEYYLAGSTLARLAFERSCSVTQACKLLQRAEGVIDGMLLGRPLEMDRDVSM